MWPHHHKRHHRKLMNPFAAFFAKYSTYSHAVAAVFASLILAYAEVPAFHTLVLTAYNDVPAGVQQILLAAVGLYAWYRNGEVAPTPPAA